MAQVIRDGHEGFVMFIGDELPLASYDMAYEMLVDEEVKVFNLSVTLDRGSAEDLQDSGVFPAFDLPEIQPLSVVQVRLDLTAGDALKKELSEALKSGRTATQILLDRPNGAVTNYRRMSSYQLLEWVVNQTQTAPDEFVKLAFKEPDPL